MLLSTHTSHSVPSFLFRASSHSSAFRSLSLRTMTRQITAASYYQFHTFLFSLTLHAALNTDVRLWAAEKDAREESVSWHFFFSVSVRIFDFYLLRRIIDTRLLLYVCQSMCDYMFNIQKRMPCVYQTYTTIVPDIHFCWSCLEQLGSSLPC